MKATCEATAREIAFCLCVTLLARRVTVYVQCGTLLDKAVKHSCTGSIILGLPLGQQDSKPLRWGLWCSKSYVEEQLRQQRLWYCTSHVDYIPPAGSFGSLLGRMHPCHSSNEWSCLVYVILCSRDPVVYTLRRFLPPVCHAMMRSASSDLSPQAAVRSRTFKQRARYCMQLRSKTLL